MRACACVHASVCVRAEGIGLVVVVVMAVVVVAVMVVMVAVVGRFCKVAGRMINMRSLGGAYNTVVTGSQAPSPPSLCGNTSCELKPPRSTGLIMIYTVLCAVSARYIYSVCVCWGGGGR